MKRKSLLVWVWLVSSVCVVAAAYLGTSVKFAQQWPLFEALRATAAIIFAVIGAWLAIIYPDRLRLSFGALAKKQTQEGFGLRALFAPIVHSTLILSAVLLIGVLAPLLRPLAIVREHVALCRGFSYGVLVALTLWQLFTVLLTLVPADVAKTAVDDNVAHADAVRSHFSAAQTRPKPSSSDQPPHA